ncbi:MAG: hypothetical protein UY63_C0017G0062 [Parcubacteria group bacterium GW2011_GWA2_51_10]|nr:MAG: hypothetical protein UY63_C0017G0062 [Parcubacteria group bacterium GW2011_GWA2_51_10]
MKKFHMQTNIREAYESRHEPESMHVIADFYWRTLLLVALLLVVLFALYGSLEFMRVANDTAIDAASEQAPARPERTFNRSRLQAVLDSLNAREAQFESLKKSAPTVVDPSR